MTASSTHKTVIAILGAGKGGCSLLKMLLRIPMVEVRYVCDLKENAEGMQVARDAGVQCSTDPVGWAALTDDEVDMILELTGKDGVYQELLAMNRTQSSVVASGATRLFSDLIDAEKSVRRELEEHKQGLESVVAERTLDLQEANRALNNTVREYQELSEKLQQINDEKTRYLLRSTHQLKAPFAAIQSYLDLILDGYVGEIDDKVRGILGKIHERANTLALSLTEMLKLANLRACVTDNLSMQEVDLSLLLNQSVAESSAIARASDVAITHNDDDADSKVYCCRDQLRILVDVLLENAIRYSNKGGEVVLDHSTTNGLVTLNVRDNGIGIDPENLERIFDVYFRSNAAADKYHNGSGIGLAIVKEIAEINSFDVSVQSEPGKGTTFSVQMPIAKAPSA